jgi:plasma-membrane proton-efflux P-type ATPase
VSDSEDGAQPTAVELVRSLGSSDARGLTESDAQGRLARDGANEVLDPPAHRFRQFAKKFWGVSAWMIELIVVLSAVLHRHADMAIGLALLVVNAVLGFAQERRASTVIEALKQRLQITARVLRDARWRGVPARELVAGDVVRVRAGDFVPADMQILAGDVQVDQSALTGESQLVDRATDAAVHAGSTVRNGEATGVVTATGGRTSFGETTQLVQSAHPRLHVEVVIARVVRWLLSIVGALVVLTTVGALVEGQRIGDVLPISLVLLMSAIPVALPVMFTVSTAVGARELGRRGVLITRLSAVEDAANMDMLCADKTGTLTLNQLALVGVVPSAGCSDDDVVDTGALASNEANADPIDLAFLRAAVERTLTRPADTISFAPFSAATRRTEAIVRRDGHEIRAAKGALRTIAELAGLDPAQLAGLEEVAVREASRGVRVLAVARSDDGAPLRIVGLALLRDPPRPDSKQLIDQLRALGVSVKMLTGDALAVARDVGATVGLPSIARASELRDAGPRAAEVALAADGFAEVFPDDKFRAVSALQAAGHVVGMTGDGVNDAPALRQAEVGIAVSSATDIAKGAASAVLTTAGLTGIVDLVRHGRATYQRVLTWIVNKVSRTILKAGFVVISFLATGRFVISALGMVLLVFMTDFVKISLATDRVRASPQPETWKIGPLIGIAVVLGVLMLAEALGLLAFGWHRFGLAGDDGMLAMFSFQVLLFLALFSIVSIRERRAFWSSRPGRLLAIGIAGDAVIAIVVGTHGISELHALPNSVLATLIGYAAVCCLGINDVVKTLLISRAMRRRTHEAAGTTTVVSAK